LTHRPSSRVKYQYQAGIHFHSFLFQILLPITQARQTQTASIDSKMAPKLEHVFTMRGYMDAVNSVNLSAIKSGPHRIIVPINGGFIEGSGLKAQVLPGSGDWILVREPFFPKP
jgi:hypothetical protein